MARFGDAWKAATLVAAGIMLRTTCCCLAALKAGTEEAMLVEKQRFAGAAVNAWRSI